MSDLISKEEVINAMSAWDWQELYLPIHFKQLLEEIPSAQPEIIRCKECKHFEYDHFENVNGIPLIVAHEICLRWSDGVKTSENGYCFLAERKDNG